MEIGIEDISEAGLNGLRIFPLFCPQLLQITSPVSGSVVSVYVLQLGQVLGSEAFDIF